jgi:putative transposase
MLSSGHPMTQVLQHLGVSEQTFHRGRNQYGGMKSEEAKRLKELEVENARLKPLVAEKELDILILRALNAYVANSQAPRGRVCTRSSVGCTIATRRCASLGRRRLRSALASPTKASCVVDSSWCRALCPRVPNGCLRKLCSAPTLYESHATHPRTCHRQSRDPDAILSEF